MFNILKESKTRIITGLALILGLIVIGLIHSFIVMWILFGILMIVALKESLILFNIDSTRIYTYAIILWLISYFYPQPIELVFIIAIIFASKLAYKRELDKKLFLPLLYPITPFLFLLSLYSNFGIDSLIWLLVVVAGADIGAYFVGKSIGKTQFCKTSPNKTIEGVVGGIVLATILGSFASISLVSICFGIIISLLVAISSIFGDLFESYLKREANVKDSGDILPGHGGILDRTDGYLFGGVIMLILLKMVLL